MKEFVVYEADTDVYVLGVKCLTDVETLKIWCTVSFERKWRRKVLTP